MYDGRLQHSCALPLKLIFLELGVAVRVHGDGRCARKEVDLVVIGVQWGQPVREDGPVAEASGQW